MSIPCTLLLTVLLGWIGICSSQASPNYNTTNACIDASHGVDLATCAFGYGGGMSAYPVTGGSIPYVVTSEADTGVGTLRDALSQSGRYITFAKSMTIVLTSASLRPPSNTTIDGRNQTIVITGKSIRIQSVSNIIVANLALLNLRNYTCPCHNCDDPLNIEFDDECADAMHLESASRIWFVHNLFSNSRDGLLDMKNGCHHITVSHNKFMNHDKVSLIGSSDSSTIDKVVRVTFAYNYFLFTGQRTPRVRFGVAHLFNNVYESWQVSAMGASSGPTIISEGNTFIANATKSVSDFKDVGIYVSRNDRLLNGAKPIATAGPQNTTITDYTYSVFPADDRLRYAIVQSAGTGLILPVAYPGAPAPDATPTPLAPNNTNTNAPTSTNAPTDTPTPTNNPIPTNTPTGSSPTTPVPETGSNPTPTTGPRVSAASTNPVNVRSLWLVVVSGVLIMLCA